MRGTPEKFQERIMRLPEVLACVGLSRATIYRLIDMGSFPKQRKLGVRSVGWYASDIEAWLAERMYA